MAQKVADRAAGSGKLRVTQLKSPIGFTKSQRLTLIGLGLNRIGRSVLLEDSPSIRGMVFKVQHLVKLEEVQA